MCCSDAVVDSEWQAQVQVQVSSERSSHELGHPVVEAQVTPQTALPRHTAASSLENFQSVKSLYS